MNTFWPWPFDSNKQYNQLGSTTQAKITAINYSSRQIFVKTCFGEHYALPLKFSEFSIFQFCVNQCIMIEKDQNGKVVYVEDYDIWEKNQKSLSKINTDFCEMIQILKERKIISNRFEKVCIFISLIILFGWIIFK